MTLRFTHTDEDLTERECELTIGFYGCCGLAGWKAGEIFLDGINERGRSEMERLKTGCDLEAHLDNAATLASKLMQFGERPQDIARSCAKGSLIRHALLIAAAVEAHGPDVVVDGVAA